MAYLVFSLNDPSSFVEFWPLFLSENRTKRVDIFLNLHLTEPLDGYTLRQPLRFPAWTLLYSGCATLNPNVKRPVDVLKKVVCIEWHRPGQAWFPVLRFLSDIYYKICELEITECQAHGGHGSGRAQAIKFAPVCTCFAVTVIARFYM